MGSDSGCLHSGGIGGKLRATGVASVGADTAVLGGSDMPTGPTTAGVAGLIRRLALRAGGAGLTDGQLLACFRVRHDRERDVVPRR